MKIEEVKKLSNWTNEQVFSKTGQYLDSLQKAILEGVFLDQQYSTISGNNPPYKPDYVKEKSAELWKLLSEVFNQDIKKINVRSILENKSPFSINNVVNLPQTQIGTNNINNSHVNICGQKNQSLENRESRSNSPQTKNQLPIIDLTEAPEINYNYSRIQEVNIIKEWLENKTKLITIYGLKGIGKTALILKLIAEINTEFDYIIYKSLDEISKLSEFKNNLKNIFSQCQATPLGDVIDCFKSFRCLVIIDDIESLFKTEELAGQYLSEYQDYGKFFEQIANKTHQSSVILISQEKSPDIEILENNNNHIKTLKLEGLKESAKEILREKGLKNAEKWEELIRLYQAHPTWLKIIAGTIQQLYNGDVTEFLTEENDIFIGDIKFYLQPHLEVLSQSEFQLIQWLANQNQPVNITQISTNLELSQSQLVMLIQSLLRRCLVEKIAIESKCYYELNKIFKEYFKQNQKSS